MARKFFSGSTLEQAVLGAARYYETEPERVAYREREKKHGFLNVRRKFVIEVDPSALLRPEGEEVPWQPNLAGVDHPMFDGSPAPSSAPKEAADTAKPPPPKPESSSRDSGGSDARSTRSDAPSGPAADGHASDGPASEDRASGDQATDARTAEDRSPSEDGSRDGRRGDDSGGRRGRGRGRRGGGRQDSGRPNYGRPDHDRHSEEAEADDAQYTWITAEESDIPQMDDPLDAVDDSLGEIADFLLYDMQWEIRQEDDESVSVDLSGDDGDRIVAREAEVMHAIEHLLPRFVRSRFGETLHIAVDCDGYQARHEDEVRAHARQIADDVRSSREAQLLEPMPPADRRLVHISLADDPNVVTESEGYGFTKRVRIAPN